MVLGAAHRSFDFLFSGAVSHNWAARHCSYGEEMTDRELLEMAAKAAGALACWSSTLDEWQKDLTDPYVGGKKWNPLTDDGDALRLAAKLCLNVFIGHEATGVNDGEIPTRKFPSSIEAHRGDPYAATRRAIVRAAAELGKETK